MTVYISQLLQSFSSLPLLRGGQSLLESSSFVVSILPAGRNSFAEAVQSISELGRRDRRELRRRHILFPIELIACQDGPTTTTTERRRQTSSLAGRKSLAQQQQQQSPGLCLSSYSFNDVVCVVAFVAVVQFDTRRKLQNVQQQQHTMAVSLDQEEEKSPWSHFALKLCVEQH